jgi:hypothetical protein
MIRGECLGSSLDLLRCPLGLCSLFRPAQRSNSGHSHHSLIVTGGTPIVLLPVWGFAVPRELSHSLLSAKNHQSGLVPIGVAGPESWRSEHVPIVETSPKTGMYVVLGFLSPFRCDYKDLGYSLRHSSFLMDASSPPRYRRFSRPGPAPQSADLPAYTRRNTLAQPIARREPVEHLYPLSDSKGRPWATLSLRSSAKSGKSVPTFFEKEHINGSFQLTAEKGDSIQSVTVTVSRTLRVLLSLQLRLFR